MSTLMIPDSLKLALRDLHKEDPENNAEFTESEKEHEWIVTYSYSEYSGYHDESNIYVYTTTVLDHEPVLEDAQEWRLREEYPGVREKYEKLFHGYHIVDMTSYTKHDQFFHFFSIKIIKLDCSDPEYPYTRPLWVLFEEEDCR